jgi:hypothetical protein
MPKSAAPRKKYRPKGVIRDTMGWVRETHMPIREHDNYVFNLKIKNHGAMRALFTGKATFEDIRTLIAMHNLCEGLWQMEIGKDYGGYIIRGKVALLDVHERGESSGKYILHAAEMQALNDLLELFDEQMEVCTLGDIEKARELALKSVRDKKAFVLRTKQQLLEAAR